MSDVLWPPAKDLYSSPSFVLKALLHFFQREQEMRVGELGPRGAINMAGTGMTVYGLVGTNNQVKVIMSQ